MLAVKPLSQFRWSRHWAVTLSRWPCLLHPCTQLEGDVKEPVTLFEKSRGRPRCHGLSDLCRRRSGWASVIKTWTDVAARVRLYILTSDLTSLVPPQFSHWLQVRKVVTVYLPLYVIYDRITIMEYSKHELSIINMLYSLKKLSNYRPTSPQRPRLHNGHFLLSPMWPLFRGSTVLNWKHLIFSKEKRQQKKHIRHDFVIMCSVVFQVLLIALGFKHSPRNTAFYHHVRCAVRKSLGTSTAKWSWRLLWERLTDRRETPWWDHGYWERLAYSTGNDLVFDLL